MQYLAGKGSSVSLLKRSIFRQDIFWLWHRRLFTCHFLPSIDTVSLNYVQHFSLTLTKNLLGKSVYFTYQSLFTLPENYSTCLKSIWKWGCQTSGAHSLSLLQCSVSGLRATDIIWPYLWSWCQQLTCIVFNVCWSHILTKKPNVRNKKTIS